MLSNPYENSRAYHQRLIKTEGGPAHHITYSLKDILAKVNPTTPVEVIDAIETIILALRPLLSKNPDESTMYLRGGTSRAIFFDTSGYNILLKGLWPDEPIKSSLIGASPLAKAILQHATSEVTDSDFELNEDGVYLDGETVIRPNDELIPNLIEQALDHIGWKNNGKGELQLTVKGFTAHISSFNIGRSALHPLYKLVFTNNLNSSVVSEVSFTDIPRSEQEIRENFRFLGDGASIDALAIGYVSVKRDEMHAKDSVLVSYEKGVIDDDIGFAMLQVQIWEGHMNLSNRFVSDYVTSAANAFRTINMFISDPVSSRGYFDGSPLQDLPEEMARLLKYSSNPQTEKEKMIQKLVPSLREQLPYIKEKAVPLLSDVLFNVTVNPYIGLTMTYCSGLLDTLNLGEVINSPGRLLQILERVGDVTGHPHEIATSHEEVVDLARWYMAACLDETTDPLVILDAIRSLEYSPDEIERLDRVGFNPKNHTSRTLSDLLPLLLPRGLTYEDIE